MSCDYENNRVEELKVFLSPHFARFNELGLYYWISGGAILGFLTGQKPNDIDVYFPTKKMADQAVGLLKKKGFKIEHQWQNNRVLKNPELTYDIIHEFNNPNQIFESIRKLQNELTIILISHSNNSLKICDKIIDLDEV